MAVELSKLKALTIRQPWVDLILRGMKTVEVREWLVKHRGPFLIHVSNTVDWKAVQALGYEGAETLPRGVIAGYAEVEDVFPFTRDLWLAHLKRHWVVHPLPEPSFGAVLANVRPFDRPLRCRGKPLFFTPPPTVLAQAAGRLEQAGVAVVRDQAG